MAAIEKHTVLLNLQPLIELQANPRAMDVYTWLSYRIQSVRHEVKISYADLHSVFGKQTKLLSDFKRDFQKALELALPYIPQADINLKSDKKHLVIRNAISRDLPLEI